MENSIPLHNNIFVSITSSFRKYVIEICLISIAAIITIISIMQQIHNQITPLEAAVEPIKQPISIAPPLNKSVFVDVSGAVYNPGVYEASAGARIGDLVEMAGGISYEADRYFVARNFNMARFVGDQDKIYIPFMFDIALGTFTEQKRVLEYLQPLGEDASEVLEVPKTDSTNTQSQFTLSLNKASAEELETLTGIGPVTAQKIIENRPYITLEDLLNKKVMNQSTYDKIKSHIEL